MARHEDTPDLFGGGVGIGTAGTLRCGICGNVYNPDADEKEDYSGDSVGYTNFAGFIVADCCFEDVEREVLSRLEDILPWFARIVAKQRVLIGNRERAIQAIVAALR